MKKYLFSIIVMAIFVVGFSASNFFSEPIPGTYNLDGGYVMTIDDDLAVRLKAPNGKVYKGSATDGSLFDYHVSLTFKEDVPIMHLNDDDWVIDEDVKYMYSGWASGSNFSSKDEDKRIRIISYHK